MRARAGIATTGHSASSSKFDVDVAMRTFNLASMGRAAPAEDSSSTSAACATEAAPCVEPAAVTSTVVSAALVTDVAVPVLRLAATDDDDWAIDHDAIAASVVDAGVALPPLASPESKCTRVGVADASPV